jgi:hypothetical protein
MLSVAIQEPYFCSVVSNQFTHENYLQNREVLIKVHEKTVLHSKLYI